MNQMEIKDMSEDLKAKNKYFAEAIKIFLGYEDCIKSRMQEIITALGNNDFCAIQQIFNECNVPAKKQKELMKFAIECYSQHNHIW